MAQAEHWPDNVNLNDFDPAGSQRLDQLSHLVPGEYGAKASQRQLTIDGKQVTVCFLLMEVIWDQAASILLYEASLFRPQRIIMTGGGVTSLPNVGQFEAGAFNRAQDYPGYDGAGNQIDVNTPDFGDSDADTMPILDPDLSGVVEEIPMLWDGPALVAATKDLAGKIRREAVTNIYSVTAETAARPTNTYLCNNVSYVLLHAVRDVPVALAGKLIHIQSADDDRVTWQDGETFKLNLNGALGDTNMVGFFHIPDTKTDAAQTMLGWAKVFAKVMTVDN